MSSKGDGKNSPLRPRQGGGAGRNGGPTRRADRGGSGAWGSPGNKPASGKPQGNNKKK